MRPGTPARSSSPPSATSTRPYPFPKLDLLAYPKSTFGGAMENPGLVTYTVAHSPRQARRDLAALRAVLHRRYRARDRAHVVRRLRHASVVERPVAQRVVRIVARHQDRRRKLRPDWPSGWRSRQRSEGARARSHRRRPRAAPARARLRRRPRCLRRHHLCQGRDAARHVRAVARAGQISRRRAAATWRNTRGATPPPRISSPTLGSTDDALVPAFRGFADRPGVPLLDVALDCTKAPSLVLTQQRFAPAGVHRATAGQTWTFPACFDVGDNTRSRQVCKTVRAARRAVVPLEGACPQWVLANRSGSATTCRACRPRCMRRCPRPTAC